MASRKILLQCLFLAFTLVLSCFVKASSSIEKSEVAAKIPDKVLFVGNSFSFYNNGIHNHVANLIRAKGLWQAKVNKYRLMTLSGGKLSEHSDLLANFLEQKKTQWDLVILQEVSNGPIINEDKSKFRSSAKRLVKDIESAGSKAALFMTWAYQNKPEMTALLAKAYQALGKELNIPVFPVGIAFANTQLKHPEIPLFIPDILGVENGKVTYKKTWKHPSPTGSYLAACVFYSALYGESAQGNPYQSSLSDDIAQKLQKIAWETVIEFNK
jgi:hypothetical protein